MFDILLHFWRSIQDNHFFQIYEKVLLKYISTVLSTQVSLYRYWSKYSNLNHFQTNMWRAQESSWHKKKRWSLRFRDTYDVWKKHDELMKLKSWDLQVPSFLLKGEKCEPLFIFWHTMQQQKIFLPKEGIWNTEKIIEWIHEQITGLWEVPTRMENQSAP